MQRAVQTRPTWPLALLSLAALAAGCAGDNAVHTGLGDGPSLGVTGGDAGAQPQGDGGTASDAGLDGGDGGCAGSLARPSSVAVNHCAGLGQQQSAVFIDQGCATTLFIDSAATCTGQLAGDANSFVGVCESFGCSAASLPGPIVCGNGTEAGCIIDVCASSTDTNCR